MPKNGVIASGCMHTPTTTMRLCVGATPQHLVDHPGHADRPRTRRAGGRRRRARPGLERRLVRRVDDLVGAHRRGQRAAGRREVAGDDRLDAAQAQGGDDGEADGSAAEHEGAVAGADARLVDGVQADRHRLGERGVAWVEAVGHLEQQQRRQQHPLAVPAREQVGVGEVLDAGRREHDRHRRDDRADGGPSVSGPSSTTSPENSWPMKTSPARSGGVPPEVRRRPPSATPTSSIAAPWSTKCRSDPQIPHALTSTSTWPAPGRGSATSSRTCIRPSRRTAERISEPSRRRGRWSSSHPHCHQAVATIVARSRP